MKRISLEELKNNLDYYLEQSSVEDIVVYDKNQEEVCCFTNPKNIGKRDN